MSVTILLDKNHRSERPHILALDYTTQKFLSVKISSSEELYDRSINRNYVDILNPFMIFYIDFCEAFNLEKSKKNFKSFSESFKNIPYLWEISPKEIKDTYEQVFFGFKNLKPKIKKFVSYNPQKSNNENFSKSFEEPEPDVFQEIILGQHNIPNKLNLVSQPSLLNFEVNNIQKTFNGENFNKSPKESETEEIINIPNSLTNLVSQPEEISLLNDSEDGNIFKKFVSYNSQKTITGENFETEVSQEIILGQPEEIYWLNDIGMFEYKIQPPKLHHLVLGIQQIHFEIYFYFIR